MKKIISLIISVSVLLALLLTSCSPASKWDAKYVKMSVKDHGDIILYIDPGIAPITASHFLDLVNSGFYNGLKFHRAQKNFMIQGGAGDKNSPKVDPIVGEFFENGHINTLDHDRGVISMARTGNPDSATSQFFICNGKSSHLDGKYAAFGYVVEGMEVVDSITSAMVPYTTGDGFVVSEEYYVTIESVTILTDYTPAIDE